MPRAAAGLMLAALGFLTTLGRTGRPLDARALPWFPAVGCAIGAALGGWWWLADRWWSPALAAGLVVAADLGITGMLHADGLADSADGLLPHADRERRLAIMADPATGAFGVTTLVTVVLIRFAGLGSLEPDPWLLTVLWGLSRTLVAAVPAVVPYARPDGLAQPLLAGAPHWVLGLVVPVLVLGWVAGGHILVVAGAAALLGGAGVLLFAWRRLGGFTGDVLGAAIVLGETVGLLVAALPW